MMENFPEEMGFKYEWRPYQHRVLDELQEYLEDNHLHIVAAPGSGKTLLGLEVVHRLNKPTLILTPTSAIRDQWVSRLIGFFLPDDSDEPDWISTDIRSPKFLTVSTYQGLYSAYSGKSRALQEAEIDVENENNMEQENKSDSLGKKKGKVIALLRRTGIQTIVLDEAHHLRSNWWRVLTSVVRALHTKTTLALTATPPYDVSMYEWERYLELCGPVDAEVSVPELVLESNLCPHQDLVLLSYPSPEEDSKLEKFVAESSQLVRNIEENTDFLDEVKQHRWIVNTNKHIDNILDDPAFFSSLLVFLRHKKVDIPKEAMQLISGDHFGLPWYNIEWLETLLEGILFPKDVKAKNISRVLKDIKDELYRIDAVERRNVYLSNQNVLQIDKRIKHSVGSS